MSDELLIPARYCGPPRSANGGYTSGSLAQSLLKDPATHEPTTVSVRLAQPPPLDSTMQLTRDGDVVTMTFGGAVVATARRDDRELDPVEPVSHDEAVAASAHYPGLTNHPFPTCFACGTGRPDGLRIFPGAVGPVEARHRVAAPWTPDESIRVDWHESQDEQVRACPAAAWAALDCIGAWAGEVSEGRPMVLGTMTARLETLPVVGEPHVVMGQFLGREGRRTMTATSLYDSDGRIVGVSEHTWITVDPAAFGGGNG